MVRCFPNFYGICPEPVLANIRVSVHYNGAKKTFSRRAPHSASAASPRAVLLVVVAAASVVAGEEGAGGQTLPGADTTNASSLSEFSLCVCPKPVSVN